MELTEREIADMTGGNRFFAAVAFNLRDDFCREGMPFYGQGVEAAWRRELDLYTKEERLVLAIGNGDGNGGIRVSPVTRGDGSLGLEIYCRNGEGWKEIELLKRRTDVCYALETVRLVCVARFGLVEEAAE